MKIPLHGAVLALFIWAAPSMTAALGQSLSIKKKADQSIVVEAAAPANDPHALQESANLEKWIDIREELEGVYTHILKPNGPSERYLRLRPSVPPAERIRVLLLGDSMASNCCGWGSGLPAYFKENVTFINYAAAWVSTKTFLQSLEWNQMLLIKPNYVLIQYGWMDESIDPYRYTTPEEFAANLRAIAEAVRGFNGVPIFVTLHAARQFDAEGKALALPQPRRDIMMQVAAEMDAPLIDLYKLSFDMFNELGPKQVDFMLLNLNIPEDKMHMSNAGALWVARLVANAMPDSMTPYLTRILDLPPKP